MSLDSTQEVFDLLAVANLPAHSWSAQVLRNHTVDAAPVQVVAYGHTIDTGGVVTLTFGVNHGGTLAAFVGTFKNPAPNQITRGGNILDAPVDPADPPQTYVPVDAGVDNPDPDNIPLQLWYRWNEGADLREFRFATTIKSPVSLPGLG